MGYLLTRRKSYEKRRPFIQPESERPQLIVFSGVASLLKNIRGICNEIELLDVDGIVWNSLLSLDRADPTRYRSMAEQILQSLNYQRETHLIAHSFGSAELIRALLECQILDSDFFNQDLQNLHVTLVSPSGMFAGVHGLVKYVKEDLPTLIQSLSKESPHHIIDSLMCFPPHGLSQTEVLIILHTLYPKLAQTNLNDSKFDFAELPDIHDYSDNLRKGDRIQLRALDAEIERTFHTVKRDILPYSGMKQLLKERAHILRRYLDNVYAGECYPQPETFSESFNVGLFSTALIHFLPALKEKFFGRFPVLFKQLRRQGASLQFLVPVHDTFVPFDRIASLFPDEEITLIPGTHMTFPIQPQSVLAAAMREHR